VPTPTVRAGETVAPYLRIVLSRVTGVLSALLTLLSVLFAWGVAASPDSDLKVGLFVALPSLALAAAFALVALWTRATDRD
jgi:hypothetical protein